MEKATLKRFSAKRAFWTQWVLASSLGFGSGVSLFGTLAALGGDGSQLERIGLILWATIFGSAQWFVLRRIIPSAGLWVLTPLVGLLIGSILGFSLGAPLGNLIGDPPADFIVSLLLTFVLSGAFIGLLQWLVLRKSGLISVLWIPANALSWFLTSAVCVGLAFALGVDAEMLNRGVLPFFIRIGLIGIVGGAVLGMITGGILARGSAAERSASML